MMSSSTVFYLVFAPAVWALPESLLFVKGVQVGENANTPPIAASKVEAETRMLCGLVMVVLLISCLAGSYIYRERILDTPRSVLFANSCVLLYTVLTISADIIMQLLHGGNAYKFHPAVMVFLAEFGKLVLNGGLAIFDYKNTKLCSPNDFLTTLKLMTLPAVCFISLNLLRYHALASADLGEYRVFRSFDVVVVAVLWCLAFKRTLKVTQIVGVGLVTLSCISLAFGSAFASSTPVRGWQTAVVLVMAFISSLGMVTNEMGLRGLPHLSLFTQNCSLYLLTCSLNFIYILAFVPLGSFFEGLDGMAMVLLAVEVLLGMCVACVLKYADAIVKQLATGWITPLEPLIGHWFVGTPLTPISVFCTLLAGLGNVIYRMEPPRSAGAEGSASLPLCSRGGEPKARKSAV